jgi:hypothetical protein
LPFENFIIEYLPGFGALTFPWFLVLKFLFISTTDQPPSSLVQIKAHEKVIGGIKIWEHADGILINRKKELHSSRPTVLSVDL